MRTKTSIVLLTLIPLLLSATFSYSNITEDEDIIFYTTSIITNTSAPLNRVVFSPTTNINTLRYDGIATFEDQLLDLSNENKPTIEISNTTHRLWELSFSYTTFIVNNREDNHIQFALLNNNGSVADSYGNNYILIAPNEVVLVHKSTENNILYTVPWGYAGEDLLKLLLPAYRHDLNGKDISSVITWNIELTPSSEALVHIWDGWNNHSRSCTTCGHVDSHTANWGAWNNHSRSCTICGLVNSHTATWGAWSNHSRSCTTCGLVNSHTANWGTWSNHSRSCITCGLINSHTANWGAWSNHSRSCTICGHADSHTPSWGAWSNHSRSCATCSHVDSHTASWGSWTSINSSQHRRNCNHCTASETGTHNDLHRVPFNPIFSTMWNAFMHSRNWLCSICNVHITSDLGYCAFSGSGLNGICVGTALAENWTILADYTGCGQPRTQYGNNIVGVVRP
ncbi:MAG: hypothetical protein LBC71_08615 [Oscillospiraceae bacterium]|jgi:hypothetical protein|nr:hypothetical protein [Oscillospiraceae bacterium]